MPEVVWVLMVMMATQGQHPVASFVAQADCENFIEAFARAREKPPAMECVSVPSANITKEQPE